MGINYIDLKLIFNIIDKLEKKNNISICDLGNQQIRKSCYDFFKEKGIPRFKHTKQLFEYLKYNHTSIDCNGDNNSISIDLSIDIKNQNCKLLDKFDLITNFGTSEHVGEFILNKDEVDNPQYYCFKNIHDMLKNNGIVIHCIPLVNNWKGHGVYEYTHKFFNSLCSKNNYEIILKDIMNTHGDGYDNLVYVYRKVNNDGFMTKDSFNGLEGLIPKESSSFRLQRANTYAEKYMKINSKK
jgi:hypothetical protein